LLTLVYLADQIYVLSSLGIIISELRRKQITVKTVFSVVFEAKYLILSMPIFLAISLPLITAFFAMENVSLIFIAVLGGAETLIFVYFILAALLVSIKERRQVENIKRHLTELNLIQFVKILGSLTGKTYRQELIRIIFTKQLLISTDVNLIRLRNLIAFVQATFGNPHTLEQFEQLRAIDNELVLALGFVNANDFGVENYWSAEQLDLLCKMLEQIQQLSRAKV
jgi:hypothetical protein